MNNGLLIKDVILDGNPCNILIQDGVIASIMRADERAPEGCTLLEGRGMTVMPAFINMHTHSGMTLFRGICEDMPLSAWLDAVWKAEEVLDEDFIYWGTRLACLEMIKCGVSSFADMYWNIDVAARAVAESGMRAVLSYCFLDGGDRNKQLRQREECMEMYSVSRQWPERISFGVSLHAHYTVCDENMIWASEFARSNSLLLQTHLSETRQENDTHYNKYGVSPTQRLASMGILGEDLIAAHSLWLSEEDVRLLGETGTTVVHNINSNLKLASGSHFLYSELKDAGANVTMGTDGCGSSNNLDLREALKTAALVQKAWRQNPGAWPLDELLDVGTRNAAKALRIHSGVIEEGACADLVLVDTRSPFFIPASDFRANLIYAAGSSCFDTLICDGRVQMRNRKVEGEEEILERAASEARRFVNKIR